jgi:hypothetical protein
VGVSISSLTIGPILKPKELQMLVGSLQWFAKVVKRDVRRVVWPWLSDWAVARHGACPIRQDIRQLGPSRMRRSPSLEKGIVGCAGMRLWGGGELWARTLG